MNPETPISGEPVLSESGIARLMARYAGSLDRKELEAWAAFFTDDARYSVASSENAEAGFPLRLINDGSKSRIEDRVRYVRKFWEGNFNDYAPRHILSAPVLLDVEVSMARFEQPFALYATEPDVSSNAGGLSSLVCVGRYLGRVRNLGGELKLVELEAVLDTFAIARSLVYPC